ncbi:uncharacterized protein LOC114746922 isoform X2 [Neltuma alba]|nr:uncharacterized protein LOC114722250 isoform X2 [Prosopis alba]XP_028791030.1 uncharacterized protein LOC114746922 isoform X2 [Prosopis alba]
MSPRISFSSDFVDVQQAIKQERLSRDAPASPDFEFSVTNYSMMSADELFYKGRLLPFKDERSNQMQRTTTTLREELLHDDEYEDFSQRPPKGSSSRRKGFMGLRKSHFGSKKADKSEGSSDAMVGGRRSRLVNESARVNVTSQDSLNDGSSGS